MDGTNDMICGFPFFSTEIISKLLYFYVLHSDNLRMRVKEQRGTEKFQNNFEKVDGEQQRFGIVKREN